MTKYDSLTGFQYEYAVSSNAIIKQLNAFGGKKHVLSTEAANPILILSRCAKHQP